MKTQYRPLIIGETIQKGDRFKRKNSKKTWAQAFNCYSSIGSIYNDDSNGDLRSSEWDVFRPIPTGKEQQDEDIRQAIALIKQVLFTQGYMNVQIEIKAEIPVTENKKATFNY